jgi:hypothetical protein
LAQKRNLLAKALIENGWPLSGLGCDVEYRTTIRLTVSQLASTERRFPVELGDDIKLHAAFREGSRPSSPSVSATLQEIRGTTLAFVLRKTTPRDLYQT